MSNKIRMRLDNWTYIDFTNFIRATTEGSTELSYKLAAKLIDGSAGSITPESIFEMSVPEAAEVMGQVQRTVQKYSQDVDTEGIAVRLDAWNMKRFLEFSDAIASMNTAKVLRMALEICPDFDFDDVESVPFTDGAMMVMAIRLAYRGMIEGQGF